MPTRPKMFCTVLGMLSLALWVPPAASPVWAVEISLPEASATCTWVTNSSPPPDKKKKCSR